MKSYKSYKSYKYRIYPTKDQEELIQKTFGCVRFVYNYFLNEKIAYYNETGKLKTFEEQIRELTILKKENGWLREPDKNALQYSLIHLDKAYKQFFKNMRENKKPGFPNFKKKKDRKKSYSTAANKNLIFIEGRKIRIPKVGFLKAAISRNIPSENKIISATISQVPSGKYFISILTSYNFIKPDVKINSKNALGIDYSSTHFYVDSENHAANMKKYYRDIEEKIKKESRKLSNMKTGSKNWEKQRIKIAKLFEYTKNARADWQHKEADKLSSKYDIISVEDICLEEISQHLNLGKATYDNGFRQFVNFLKYKTEEKGKTFIIVDKWFPSSKICSVCGSINDDLCLSDKKWLCKSCNTIIQRDFNAAINIRNYALNFI